MPAQLLVVDDDDSIRTCFLRYFEAKGFSIRAAASAEEAIRLTQKERFGLIFLDSVLPGMSGMRAIGELRRHSQAKLILMTGHFDEEFKKDALLMGATEVLGKPLDFIALEASVRAHLAH